jgi:hypothetical protein
MPAVNGIWRHLGAGSTDFTCSLLGRNHVLNSDRPDNTTPPLLAVCLSDGLIWPRDGMSFVAARYDRHVPSVINNPIVRSTPFLTHVQILYSSAWALTVKRTPTNPFLTLDGVLSHSV